MSGKDPDTINFPSALGIVGKDRRIYLDLGKVQVVATMKLNDNDLGVLWKPPYRVDVTGAVKAGDNRLEVGVTNLWINRMVGSKYIHPRGE